jgi:hypothetical protein
MISAFRIYDVSHVSLKQQTSSLLADEPARRIAFREAQRL